MTGPPGIEGQNVLREHSLKQDYRVSAVLQNQPVLRRISGEDLEAKLLVKGSRSLNVLDRQADRKCTKFHGRSFVSPPDAKREIQAHHTAKEGILSSSFCVILPAQMKNHSFAGPIQGSKPNSLPN